MKKMIVFLAMTAFAWTAAARAEGAEARRVRDTLATADTAQKVAAAADSLALREEARGRLTREDSAATRRLLLGEVRLTPRPKVDFSFRQPQRQRYFFAIHDWTGTGMPSRVSSYDFFPAGGGREFRYLWNGRTTPWVTRGSSADYWEAGQKGHVFHFFRKDGKLSGWGWERRD